MVCFLFGNADWCCCGQCDFLVATYRSAISLANGIPGPSKAMFEDRKKSAACVEKVLLDCFGQEDTDIA
jgi:hypothetical protein